MVMTGDKEGFERRLLVYLKMLPGIILQQLTTATTYIRPKVIFSANLIQVKSVAAVLTCSVPTSRA